MAKYEKRLLYCCRKMLQHDEDYEQWHSASIVYAHLSTCNKTHSGESPTCNWVDVYEGTNDCEK